MKLISNKLSDRYCNEVTKLFKQKNWSIASPDGYPSEFDRFC